MNVPVFHGLSVADLVRPAGDARPFPFDAPNHHYFYRARNAIFHLFKALRSNVDRLVVLAPDYNSGNEELAMRAAGATVRHYPVGRNMTLDPSAVERLCETHRPDVLYVTHYLGWPQPMTAVADLCGRRRIRLVEDCALALLSECDGRPLGTFGDWSIFCLYKTLPVPNGAVLVENGPVGGGLTCFRLRRTSAGSVAGRTAELVVQGIRSRAAIAGNLLQSAKRAAGHATRAVAGRSTPIGDIGFELADVDLAMSPASEFLLRRLDFAQIKGRRVENFAHLSEWLRGRVSCLKHELPDGVCPLFFPILVSDKHAAASALGAAGVEAIEFWNDSVVPDAVLSPAARFLHAHVLELPIHQNLSAPHIEFMAKQVLNLHLGLPSAFEGSYAA